MASSSASSSAAVFGFAPIRVVEDVINAYSDYVCDCADAMEAKLLEHPHFQDKREQIKQGVDLWMSKTQRAADKSFDKFELRVLKEVFSVPEDLQLAPPEVAPTSQAGGEQLDAEMDELWLRLQQVEAEAEAEVGVRIGMKMTRFRLDAETDEWWLRLQQALATKRELQRKLTAAQTTTQLWETHRESVRQLAAAHQADAAEAAIQGVQRVTSTLQEGWQRARAAGGAPEAQPLAGTRGLQQRFAQRRMEISTVSVPDLLQLSSLLTAS